MIKFEPVKVGDFLTERKSRYKPKEASKLGLKRIDKIDFSGKIFISDKPTNTDMILVKPHDLVISGINVEKGCISVYEGSEDLLATIHYSSYEYDKKKINVDYLKWYLKSSTFKKTLNETVGSGIKTEIKAKHLLALEIDLPSVHDQSNILNRINAISTEISELESEAEHQGNLVSKLRKSILQEAVMGKLVPQDPKDEPASALLERIKSEKEKLIKDGKLKKAKPLPPITPEEIPYELPTGWVWCRLGEVSNKIQDGTHFSPQLQYDEKKKGTYLYLTSKNIKENGIELSGATYIDEEIHKSIYSRCRPEYGDVLLIKDGAITGRVTINDIEEEFSLLSSVALIKTDKKNIENKYLMYYLRSPVGFEKITGKMTGSAIPRIILEKIKNTMFSLPPLAEQKRIVEKVDQLMKWCDELESNIESSRADAEKLMQAVLREAFEGAS